MALPIFSLGQFDFITLENLAAGGRGGAPELPQTLLEIVQRAGVNGTAYINLAKKGMPFQVRSLVDVASEDDAQTLIAAYYDAVGGDKLPLVWRDNNYYTNHQVMFEVLRVEAPRMQVMGTIVGGLNVAPGDVGVVVEAIWTLNPDEVS